MDHRPPVLFASHWLSCILTTQVNQINHKSPALAASPWESCITRSRLSNFVLQFPFNQGANLFHTPTIHTKVAITGPGSRPELNRLCCVIKDKFHIIDEPQQETGEFIVEIPVVFFDESGARQSINDGLQRVLRASQILLIPIWRDLSTLIGRLRRHAVGTRGAGRKYFHGIAVRMVRTYTEL